MDKQKGEYCTRYRVTYRDENLYIIVGEDRIHLQQANTDNFKTTAGLALVERLVNELLDSGIDLEELAGIIFECSLRSDDLPRLIQNAILYHIDTGAE